MSGIQFTTLRVGAVVVERSLGSQLTTLRVFWGFREGSQLITLSVVWGWGFSVGSQLIITFGVGNVVGVEDWGFSVGSQFFITFGVGKVVGVEGSLGSQFITLRVV